MGLAVGKSAIRQNTGRIKNFKFSTFSTDRTIRIFTEFKYYHSETNGFHLGKVYCEACCGGTK